MASTSQSAPQSTNPSINSSGEPSGEPADAGIRENASATPAAQSTTAVAVEVNNAPVANSTAGPPSTQPASSSSSVPPAFMTFINQQMRTLKLDIINEVGKGILDEMRAMVQKLGGVPLSESNPAAKASCQMLMRLKTSVFHGVEAAFERHTNAVRAGVEKKFVICATAAHPSPQIPQEGLGTSATHTIDQSSEDPGTTAEMMGQQENLALIQAATAAAAGLGAEGSINLATSSFSFSISKGAAARPPPANTALAESSCQRSDSSLGRRNEGDDTTLPPAKRPRTEAAAENGDEGGSESSGTSETLPGEDADAGH